MRKPSLFVLGDSISIHYGPYLRQYLSGIFDYDRKRGKGIPKSSLNKPVGYNGGDSNSILNYLIEQKRKKKLKYDFILLNCGLHDIKTSPKTGKKQVRLNDYKKNLKSILALLKKTAIKVIWIRITHVNDRIHRSKCKDFLRFNKDVNKYNKAADIIMKNNRIKAIDLNTFTKNTGKKYFIDHVHFFKNIRSAQAAFISGYLFKEIGLSRQE
ncbi:MAG: SGNH/GDSL hydrolase family protein [Candidatus Firestonebacteria bacterium]